MRGSVLRVVGRDDALALEGLEVRGGVVAVQHQPRLVLAAGAAIQADAPDDRALVVEPPHAQPLDLQRLRGDLEDAAQPFVESVARDRRTGR